MRWKKLQKVNDAIEYGKRYCLSGTSDTLGMVYRLGTMSLIFECKCFPSPFK